MFFDFSKSRVVAISTFFFIIFACVVISLYLNGVFQIGTNSRIYARQLQGSIKYYLSYKFPGFNMFNTASTFSAFDGQAANAKSVPVLVYHGLISEGSNIFSKDKFVDQMKVLKEAGWKTITLEEFYGFVKEGKSVPDKSFLLTFDDGRKDTYYPADPVLRDLDFTAVMFVITGFSMPETPRSDSNYYLSREELLHMQQSGRWELQSHGKEDHSWYYISRDKEEGHFMSNKLWLEEEGRLETETEFESRIVGDLSKSKKKLETEFGGNINAFAFPFSDYGENSLNFPESESIVARSVSNIYDMAFYQVSSSDGNTFNYPNEPLNSFMIKRIEPEADWDGAKLLSVLNQGKAKNLPYVQNSFSEDWISTWGNKVVSGTLSLSALEDGTGASAFLNGSRGWVNYGFSATPNVGNNTFVSLLARFIDSENYLSCAFSPDRILIQERHLGQLETLSRVDYNEGSYNEVPVSVSVEGNTISCSVNGVKMLSSEILDPTFSSGGIGIQVWNEEKGEAKAEIKDLNAASL